MIDSILICTILNFRILLIFFLCIAERKIMFVDFINETYISLQIN